MEIYCNVILFDCGILVNGLLFSNIFNDVIGLVVVVFEDVCGVEGVLVILDWLGVYGFGWLF